MASADEPPLPCAPNCPTNVVYDPSSYPLPAYTNGELALRIYSFPETPWQFSVGLTNPNPYAEYMLQGSDDLMTWTDTTPSQIGSSPEIIFGITNSHAHQFYRAKDVTGSDIIIYPYNASHVSVSGSGCPGSYVGSAVYPGWFIYAPDAGTTHSIVDPTGATDRRIQLTGRFGDNLCGTMPFTLPSHPDDPRYNIVLYYKSNYQGTNYPIVLKGFTIFTDAP